MMNDIDVMKQKKNQRCCCALSVVNNRFTRLLGRTTLTIIFGFIMAILVALFIFIYMKFINAVWNL